MRSASENPNTGDTMVQDKKQSMRGQRVLRSECLCPPPNSYTETLTPQGDGVRRGGERGFGRGFGHEGGAS